MMGPMKQDTRIEVDHKGRKRTLVKSKCANCQVCWIFLDTGKCIYGGPYSGYVYDHDWADHFQEPDPIGCVSTSRPSDTRCLSRNLR